MTPQSQVKHSTTEPLRSHHKLVKMIMGYSRKKYLGGEEGRRYIFLWVVGVESFQIIWVVGVWPNLITWVVGISLGRRGRKNIICPKKGEVLSNLAKILQNAERFCFVLFFSSKFQIRTPWRNDQNLIEPVLQKRKKAETAIFVYVQLSKLG